MEKQIRVLFRWELRRVIVRLPIEDSPRKSLTITVIAANAQDARMAALWEAGRRGKVLKTGLLHVIDVAVAYSPVKTAFGLPEKDDAATELAYSVFFASKAIIIAVETGGIDFDQCMEEFQKLIQ